MKDHLHRNMFFDDADGALPRFETVKYPYIEELSERAMGLFWRPQEITLGTKDRTDFENASTAIQHAFTANLKRQIMLDGQQQTAPTTLFLPTCSLPEVEDYLIKWGFYESIHSKSYTHIIRAIYSSDPGAVFDTVMDIPDIQLAKTSIDKYYEDLLNWNALRHIKLSKKQEKGFWDWIKKTLNSWLGLGKAVDDSYDVYEHKKAFWRALFASFALEGIRFMASFTCNFGIAENKILDGPAKVLKLIARDEMEHLKFTRELINTLPKEDDDFFLIQLELQKEMYELFKAVVDEEKIWSKYLFKEGTFIGLNEQILCAEMDFFAHVRLQSIGMKWNEGGPKKSGLPWMEKWLGAGKAQAALQETENDEYLIGLVDLSDDDLSGIEVKF